MTPEDEARMRRASALMGEAQRSPWEPRCIAHAFQTLAPGKLRLTMQQWIDLEDIQSPLLHGTLPEGSQLAQAWPIFFGLELDCEITPAPEIMLLAETMLAACDEAFGMLLKIAPSGTPVRQDDGCGRFLPWLTCLITQCGLSRAEALETPVGQMFALTAGDKLNRNEGWRVTGLTYAERDIPEELPPEESDV